MVPAIDAVVEPTDATVPVQLAWLPGHCRDAANYGVLLPGTQGNVQDTANAAKGRIRTWQGWKAKDLYTHVLDGRTGPGGKEAKVNARICESDVLYCAVPFLPSHQGGEEEEEEGSERVN